MLIRLIRGIREMSNSRVPKQRRDNGANRDQLAEQQPGGPVDAEGEISRRAFIGATGAALAAANTVKVGAQETVADASAGSEETGVPLTTINVTVNGRRHSLEVEDRWTLNEMLRDQVGLTGTKLGCNRGECGACTVLVDDEPVYSCSMLAVWADGRSIRTVEGLEANGELSDLQRAFMEHNAPQCGFCTSGQLMSATALLERNNSPTAQEVREALAGNLCRCSNYNAIVEAVLAASDTGGA